MQPREVGIAYDRITHLWGRDSFDMDNGIKPHQRAICFTEQRGQALDIGCGCTGRLIRLLKHHGFSPTGIDVSAEMIRLARQRDPDVTLVHADICTFNLATTFDFISAWDSIWHVPLAQQRMVIEKIVSSLNLGGVFIFSFGGIANASEHSNNVMGPNLYYSSLGTSGYLALLAELGCTVRHLEFDQWPEQHAYIVAQKLGVSGQTKIDPPQ